MDLATSGTESSISKYNSGKGYSTPYPPGAFLSDFMSLKGVEPINSSSASKEINHPETVEIFFSDLL
jgi:hypothetical protein